MSSVSVSIKKPYPKVGLDAYARLLAIRLRSDARSSGDEDSLAMSTTASWVDSSMATYRLISTSSSTEVIV